MEVTERQTDSGEAIAASSSLNKDFNHIDTREQMFAAIASHLKTLVNARLTFHFCVGDANQGVEPCINVLSNDYQDLPANSDQLATNLAVRAIATDQPCLEVVNNDHAYMIAAPISFGETCVDSLVALITDGSKDGTAEIEALQTAVNAIENWQHRHSFRESRQLAHDLAAINEIRGKLDLAQNHELGAQILADELASYLQLISTNSTPASHRDNEIDVYVAMTGQEGMPKLKAISNCDALPDDPKTTEVVESVMAEGLCQGHESHWPPENDRRQGLLCHQRMASELHRNSLTTIAFGGGTGKIQGVLVAAAMGELAPRQRRFCNAFAQSIGPSFELLKRAEQNRLEKFWNSITETYRSQKGKTILKCAAVLCGLSMIPLPDRLPCDCELRPEVRRFISVPFDARLEKSFVEPGEIVTQGQVLGQLNEREILLELNENEAELHRALKNSDGHVALHESGKAKLAQLEADRLRAHNQLLKSKIQNLEITSPIDGIVISSDLKDALGMQLTKGDSLFEVAPLDKLTVEVQIPEDDVRFVNVGMNVAIRFDAIPFQSFAGNVLRIHPASEIHNDENVFVAVVNVKDASDELRPGMQGRARISTSWKPVAWNYLRKPVAGCLRWVGW